MKRAQLPKKTVEEILDNYVNKGYGLIKSGREFGVGERVVRRILLENGIHIRSFGEAATVSNISRRIHGVNDNYFSQENSNMAYFLGFLASDGTVRKNDNSVKISLSSVDRDFLYTLKEEIGYQGELTDYITSNGFPVSELRFTSQKIKKDLAKYNIVPNKTFIYTFPKNLKKEYWIDFIRGYFDGDGSVSTAGEEAIRWQVCSANPDVLNTIVDFFFEEYNIPKVSLQWQNKVHRLYYIQYSTSAAKKIFQILYSPNCLKLPRKYEKFQSLVMK